VCAACVQWRPRGGRDGHCRRCRHHARLNRDGICRPCTVEIRCADPGWMLAIINGHAPGPRDLQLTLLLDAPRLPKVPAPRLQGRQPGRGYKIPRWISDRLPRPPPADDPAICPPQVPGQLVLVRPRRVFTRGHAKRIKDRHIAGLQTAAREIACLAGKRGYGQSWRRRAAGMARLALAARDPAEDRVREEDLDQLPALIDRRELAEALARAGLLRRHHGVMLIRPGASGGGTDQRRSCEHCLAWGGDGKRICDPCREWERRHAVGVCTRCRRLLALKKSRCRFCHLVLTEHGGDPRHGGDQLWFGGSIALQLSTARPGAYDHRRGRPETRRRQTARLRAAARQISPHLADPDQLQLFDGPPRDWSRIDRAALPALTPEAQSLLAAYDRIAEAHSWEASITDFNRRTLRILLSWLGAAAPIAETDVKAVAALAPNHGARRATQFLHASGLLIPDPAARTDVNQDVIEQQVAALPGQLGHEVGTWISVLRGEGQRPSPVMSWAAIRRYTRYVVPVIREWSNQTGTLRAITADDIRAILKTCTGANANQLLCALRSLFRALKRERIIFRDPARNIRSGPKVSFPRPLPPERLRGLLNRAPNALARFVAALAAIHALRECDLRSLQLADLDRAGGRLTVRRYQGPRQVILDELTLRLASEWLRERAQRWPHSTNPHLLVSQQTATDPTGSAMSRYGIYVIFKTLGVTPSQLRIDRILDEARHTADPVHLIRLFGIADGTALRYVYTAHPERRSTLPR